MKLAARDWRRLSGLLDEAMDHPAEKREQWLDKLDPAHHDLRDTLRSILFANALNLQTGAVLRELADSVEATEIADHVAHAAGDLVGPYRLLEKIGAGGMSTVW